MRIGIDFGGVLTHTHTPPEEGDYLKVHPALNSYEIIGEWQAHGDEPILVSSALSQANEDKAREWLKENGFDEIFSAMEFSRDQRGKVDICQRQKIETMIDDTEVQLQMLGGVVTNRVLFGTHYAPAGLHPAVDWFDTQNVVDTFRS